MTTISNVQNEKTLVKNINNVGYYSVEQFCKDAERYILAIKENRMFCRIHSVAKSGMSRTMSFHEFNVYNKPEGNNRGQILNFYSFFSALGYKFKSGMDCFTVGGCGMDMVFHTNYSIIHNLKILGFIPKDECEVLAQMTPNTI